MSGLSASLPSSAYTFLTHSANPESVTLRNGFQYTLITRGNDIRRQPGIKVSDVLNNTPNTCDFTVDGQSVAPQVGEKIEIRDSFDGNRLLFAGIVQTITLGYEEQPNQLYWNVHCIDFTWLFNRRRPFGSLLNVSASVAVEYLVGKYAPGFSTNHVQQNLAKISITLDGTSDMVTVMSAIAKAIGGGHWYVDYDQDVHFFHIVPIGLSLPPTGMPDPGAHMTVTMGVASPFQYDAGFYLFRHTFVYSDGSESGFQLCSNFVRSDGKSQFNFTGLPLGVNIGTLTVVARRIYYNKFVVSTVDQPIEKILAWCQVNDNVTQNFSMYFGQSSVVGTKIPLPPTAVGIARQADATVRAFLNQNGYRLTPFSNYSYCATYVQLISDTSGQHIGLETMPGPVISFTTGAGDGSGAGGVNGCVGGVLPSALGWYYDSAFGPGHPGYSDPNGNIPNDQWTRQWYRTKAGGTDFYKVYESIEDQRAEYILLDVTDDTHLTDRLNVQDPNLVPGASVAGITILSSVNSYTPAQCASPGGGMVQLSDQAAALNLTGGVSNGVYGLPNSIFLDVPGPGTIMGPGVFCAGFTPGMTIYLAWTASNYNGETTLSTPISYVMGAGSGGGSIGPQVKNPVMPTGANNLEAYISIDGGVTYHSIAGGQYGLSSFIVTTNITVVPTFPLAPTVNTAAINAQSAWVGAKGAAFLPATPTLAPGIFGDGNVVYFATTNVAQALENAVLNSQSKTPTKVFNGHPAGPTTACTAEATFVHTGDPIALANGLTGMFWNGNWVQFKVAFVYRDGSVSFPGPPSNTAGLQSLIKGTGITGFHVSNVPVGPDVSGLDCIGRFIYECPGISSNPNYSVNGDVPIGFVWPVPMNDPDWNPAHVYSEIRIVPDNVTTTVLDEPLTVPYNPLIDAMVSVGRGNLPYDNGDAQLAINPDPIPIWPNPDGPYLEDQDPPPDITDDSHGILMDASSQQFQVFTDLSQIRNRVIVLGSGSMSATIAKQGDLAITIVDISAYSPNGGKVRITDIGTGEIQDLNYTGVGGVVGQANIALAGMLTKTIPQGSSIVNVFQADDLDSQAFLSKVELDKDGNKTDGIHEYTISDSSLRAKFQLYMRAYAELELFSKPIVQVKYATRTPTRSGQTVHIDLSTPPCNGDFLIQDVQIDQVHDESDDLAPRYTITASSVRFELNDLLLQILNGSINASSNVSSAGAVATGVAAVFSAGNSITIAHVTLTSAQIKTLNSVPLQIIPAPGIGKVIVVLWGMLHAQQPVGLTSTRTAQMYYGTVAGGGGAPGQNAIINFQGFSAGGVPQDRWDHGILVGGANGDVFFDANTPASGGGMVTNKGLWIKASGDNSGDPAGTNVVNLTLAFMVIDQIGTT